jgi:DNA-binding PadR family transcriptional regulator
MTDDRLNATAASLLGFLHERPMTGWELVATAERRIGDFWSITQSQVYRELARMAESGLVEAGPRGSRASQPYTLTGAGRTAFEAWVDTEPARETIRFPLLLMLSFGRHLSPERRASFIERHRAMHAGQLARYEAERDQITSGGQADDPFVQATLDFGITYERAVMNWFERLPPPVTGARGPSPGQRQSRGVNAR